MRDVPPVGHFVFEYNFLMKFDNSFFQKFRIKAGAYPAPPVNVNVIVNVNSIYIYIYNYIYIYS